MTMWLWLAFLSALMLGFYDVSKKAALRENAGVSVLLLNTVFCALIFAPAIVLSAHGGVAEDSMFHVAQASWKAYGLILLKALIVLTSWTLGYVGMKHLPLTIVGPVNATRPVMVLLGAMLLFGERLNGWQWLGVGLAGAGFLMLSRSGRMEGIRFGHNRWVVCIVLATVTGAASGLFDRWLLAPVAQGGAGLEPMLVQSWSYIFQAMLMGLIFAWTRRQTGSQKVNFRWRWSILCVSLFLCATDWLYFCALGQPDAMVSIVSMVRRGGVVVSFFMGALLFHEKNLRGKAIDLLLVILSMVCLWLGTEKD